MMESDSSDDYDSDEDAAPERARAERRQSAWARAVGESDADELEKMMSDLSGAREMAMRMRSDVGGGGDAEEDATTAERERGAKREVEATPARSEMKRATVRPIAAMPDTMVTSAAAIAEGTGA